MPEKNQTGGKTPAPQPKRPVPVPVPTDSQSGMAFDSATGK